jgi:hypothetical protein
MIPLKEVQQLPNRIFRMKIVYSKLVNSFQQFLPGRQKRGLICYIVDAMYCCRLYVFMHNVSHS